MLHGKKADKSSWRLDRQLSSAFAACAVTVCICGNMLDIMWVMQQDADLSPNRLRMAYTEMVMIIRKLYQDCRLVHGDLSEYNILFHEVSNG